MGDTVGLILLLQVNLYLQKLCFMGSEGGGGLLAFKLTVLSLHQFSVLNGIQVVRNVAPRCCDLM